MTPHPTDDLAALAIGALDADEARMVRAHVAGCESCGAELHALEQAAFAVAATAERDVPDGLRSKIVERARREGAAPYLILDLPAAPSGKTWEAWVLRGETPLAAGITNDRGVTTLVLTAPLTTGDGVAVTLEPSGGVDRVTGNPVLAGKT